MPEELTTTKIPYIRRTLEQTIKKYHKHFQAIFISGPRQSGKTTLIKKLFPNYQYFNLETPTTREIAHKDPLSILSYNKLILDEAQEAPHLFSYLLEILDTNPNKKIIIAGSQNLLLHQHISQSLSGRVAVLELLPLTIKEITKGRGGKSSEIPQFSTIATIGMYPKTYIKQSIDFSTMWYQSYIQTYIERDVRKLKQIKDLLQFQDFIRVLATQAATLLNLSNISNLIGVSVTTLKEWLSILESSYIVFRLRPYKTNIKKRLTKTPKIYFYDTGLLCNILNITSPKELERSPLYGQIFENFIVANIIKMLKHKALKQNIYFLRDKTGAELDILIENSINNLTAIEIKAGKTFNSFFTKWIYKYKALLPIEQSYVIYQGKELQYMDTKVLHWQNLGKIL